MWPRVWEARLPSACCHMDGTAEVEGRAFSLSLRSRASPVLQWPKTTRKACEATCYSALWHCYGSPSPSTEPSAAWYCCRQCLTIRSFELQTCNQNSAYDRGNKYYTAVVSGQHLQPQALQPAYPANICIGCNTTLCYCGMDQFKCVCCPGCHESAGHLQVPSRRYSVRCNSSTIVPSDGRGPAGS